jgi:hypothetical protein
MLRVIEEYEDSPSRRPVGAGFLRRAGTLRVSGSSPSKLRRAETMSHGQHKAEVPGRLSGSSKRGSNLEGEAAGTRKGVAQNPDGSAAEESDEEEDRVVDSSGNSFRSVSSEFADSGSSGFEAGRLRSTGQSTLGSQLRGAGAEDTVKFADTNINQLIHHNRDSG